MKKLIVLLCVFVLTAQGQYIEAYKDTTAFPSYGIPGRIIRVNGQLWKDEGGGWVKLPSPTYGLVHKDSVVTTLQDSLDAKLNRSEYSPGGGGLGYTITVQALTSSPSDAQTVYFGMLPKAPVTAANASKVYIRKAGTIKIVNIYCYSGTAGSGENWSLYIRKNNTTDYLIATVGSATSERIFTNSSLSIPVAVGDYIEIKGVQPTWATNPATTIYGGYIYIE